MIGGKEEQPDFSKEDGFDFEGEAYFEVPDERLFEFLRLVRHTKDVLPDIQDITLLISSEGAKSGLVVGYIQDGENRITVPVGAIAPDGKAWTILSGVPALGKREDTKGTIPIRVLQPKPQSGNQ